MSKSIVFRMWKFPGFCETFLLNQIITARDCGLKTKLLVEDVQNLTNNPHQNLLENICIEQNLLMEHYETPDNKMESYLKAIRLVVLNLNKFFQLYRFLKSQKFFQIDDIFKFFFLIKLNYFDIIHVQYGTNVKPLEILKLTGAIQSKLVVSFHGHDLHFPINGRISEKDYYDDIFKAADVLTTTTGYLRSLLLELGAPEAKIKMVPVGVDTIFFFPDPFKKDLSEIKLITVGRLDDLKGQRYGIEVAKILMEKGYDFKYTFVGKGPNTVDLQKLIRSYKLENHITMVGEKSQTEVRDLLQSHDIFLMTSVLGDGNSREGQGLVSFEAQACGLPVVAFDSGGVKCTVENDITGFLVPEKDVNAMTFKVEKLIKDNNLRKIMGAKARESIFENFSHNLIRSRWCEIYDSL